jgi:hypothetical protein
MFIIDYFDEENDLSYLFAITGFTAFYLNIFNDFSVFS